MIPTDRSNPTTDPAFAIGRLRLPAPLHPETDPNMLNRLDINASTYALDTTGSVTPLNLIQVGNSDFNRVGRKVQMNKLEWLGEYAPQAAGVNQTMTRFIIVVDKNPNGALPTWADVVQDTDQTGATSNTVFCGYNFNNTDRFDIIEDVTLSLPAVNAAGQMVPSQPGAREITVRGGQDVYTTTQYKADSSPAVISDIASNSLILLTLGNQAAGAAWNIGLKFRLYFYDM